MQNRLTVIFFFIQGACVTETAAQQLTMWLKESILAEVNVTSASSLKQI